MSYGHPCSSTTGGPSEGPSSAKATLRSPALICLRDLKDVFVPGVNVGRGNLSPPDCAAEEPIIPSWAAAIVRAAVPRKDRRGWLHSSLLIIDRSPVAMWKSFASNFGSYHRDSSCGLLAFSV